MLREHVNVLLNAFEEPEKGDVTAVVPLLDEPPNADGGPLPIHRADQWKDKARPTFGEGPEDQIHALHALLLTSEILVKSLDV
jgi:hypothetical protein